MSGLEVVGVVLGAIPLIISALEHYAKGVQTIKAFRDAAREFRAVARRLEAERVVLRNTLTNLLTECTKIKAETLNSLMNQVNGEGWKEHDVKAALKQRLGDSLKSFYDHVESISEALDALSSRLHLKNNHQVPFQDANTFKQAYNRFGFTLKRTAYMEFIVRIKDDNSTLLRLAEQTRGLQLSRKHRQTPDFSTIQTHATSIFEGLHKVLHASCVASHKASMYLGTSADWMDAPGEPMAEFDPAVFRVMIHHDFVNSQVKAAPWLFQEAEVRTLEAQPTEQPGLPFASTSVSKSGRQRVVGFKLPERAGKQSVMLQGLKKIEDLCENMLNMQSMKCGTCLGYIRTISSHQRHGLYWPEKSLANHSSPAVETLTDILKKKLPLSTSGPMRTRDDWQSPSQLVFCVCMAPPGWMRRGVIITSPSSIRAAKS